MMRVLAGFAVVALVGASCTSSESSQETLPGFAVAAGLEEDLYDYRSSAGDRDLEAAVQLIAPESRSDAMRNYDLAYGDKIDLAPEASRVIDYVVLSESETEVVARACLVRASQFVNPDGSPAGPPGTESRLLIRYVFGFHGDALLLESGDRVGSC